MHEALASGYPILPLYLVEPAFWQHETSARRHWIFVHDCLRELQDALAQAGQPLIMRQGAMQDVLATLAKSFVIQGLYAHEETSHSWSYARDEMVRDYCAKHRIAFHELPSNGVARRFSNRDKWAKMRQDRMRHVRLPAPQAGMLSHNVDSLHQLSCGTLPAKDDPLFGAPLVADDSTQQGGRRAALALLKSFLTGRGECYVAHLASPSNAPQSCLRLSPHLVWGTLSSREVEQAIKNYIASPDHKLTAAKMKSLRAVSSRLAWRCHFMQKLEDQPEIEYAAMHPLYESLRSDMPKAEAERRFTAWAKGCTGYPLIDACMRSLTKTGWLPFRMRAMLVSFASYHLWLDWRLTAPHLARLFTDFEAGIHYSQFQMQSGVTGINTIRIYNPIKQSLEHDPTGSFIRHWCQELAAIETKWIHEPHLMPPLQALSQGFAIGTDYPLPIVENEAAMRAAKDKIFAIRKHPHFHDFAAQIYQKLGSRNSPERRRKPPKKPQNKAQLKLL